MNTPTTGNFFRRANMGRRRSARQALAVIPNVINSASSPGDVAAMEVNAMDNLLNSQNGSDSWSPAPSPDELVIQRRGRRRRTIVWSPDLDACKRDSLFSSNLKDRTPVKSPCKSSITLRNTPRKRLSLGDPHESEFTTPEKKKKQHKTMFDPLTPQKQFNGNLVSSLRGLSHEQLVQLIMDVVSMQEDGMLQNGEILKDIIIKKMPMADIQPLLDKLNCLRQNVYTSLVSSNLDDVAYTRATVHLDAFQKTVTNYGKRLLESQHWFPLMNYVHCAWEITKGLPQCKNQNLDTVANKCFKILSQLCMLALKKGKFTSSQLNSFTEWVDTMVPDCEDVKVCSVLLDEAKRNTT